MTAGVLVVAAILAYPVIRVGLTVLATQAEREGDTERALRLRSVGFQMFLGALVLILIAAIALALTAV